MDIKYFFIKAIWGNRTYRLFLKPFDRMTVDLRPSEDFNAVDIPLNKVCRLSDARNPEWARGFADLLFPPDPRIFHRKIWEFNQMIYGLRKLKRLHPQASALGIGCGHEELMYFLANRVARIVGTDLYEGTYLGGESADDVLLHPDKYAPFRYRRDHLEVRKMDALGLKFEAASFDFVFSLSSLEHFGTRADKLRSLREMNRVLKPGGVAALTTELVLNKISRRKDYFRIDGLLSLAREAGFVWDEPLDLAVEKEFADPPLAMSIEMFRTPHIVLRNFGTIYTSFSLFLRKPNGSDRGKNALVGDEIDAPPEPFVYRAAFKEFRVPSRVKAGADFPVSLTLRNEGDIAWYRNSSRSHIVKVGAWIANSQGNVLGGEPQRITLPRDVAPGEEITVEAKVPAPLEKGAYLLHFDLVKEFCFWFREKGSPVPAAPFDVI